MSTAKRVVVTGGAGFIGSALLRYLANKTDWHLFNVDKLTYAGNLSNLDALAQHPHYRFFETDICDAPALTEIFSAAQPDVVVHLAAESHVDRSIDGAGDFIKTNLEGTWRLLDCARIHYQHMSDARRKAFRFIHVSTDEVFGDLGSDGAPFEETHRYSPNSPYAATKAGSDHLARCWFSTYGLPVIVTNCSNNYGPYQFPEKLIPHIIVSALKGHRLPVYGRGEQIRDWLHVDDHADALYRVMCNGRPGETYNIGGQNEQRNIDLVHALCDELDYRLNGDSEREVSSFRDLIEFVADRPGHDFRYAINADKIISELGWRPQHGALDGLKQTVGWYLNNQPWWEAVLSGEYRLQRIGSDA